MPHWLYHFSFRRLFTHKLNYINKLYLAFDKNNYASCKHKFSLKICKMIYFLLIMKTSFKQQFHVSIYPLNKGKGKLDF